MGLQVRFSYTVNNAMSINEYKSSYFADESGKLRRTQTIGFTQRILDWAYGYDYFISYRWSDGQKYAIELANDLQRNGFECFLDRRDFVKGDNWLRSGKRALQKTSRLVLVGSPEAIRPLNPKPESNDPILKELRLFTATKKRVIPINIGGCLNDAANSQSELLRYLDPEGVWIDEEGDRLALGPSESTLRQLQSSFQLERQSIKRTRFFILIAAILFSLTLIASLAAVLATRQSRKLEVANKKLSKQLQASRLFADSLSAIGSDPTEALRKCELASNLTPNDQALRAALFDMISTKTFYKASYKGHQGRLQAIALSQNGRYCASASNKETILWDFKSSSHRILMKYYEAWNPSVCSIAFLPGAEQIALARKIHTSTFGTTRGADILIFNIAGKLLKRIDQRVESIMVSPRYNHILAIGKYSSTILWQIGESDPQELLDLGRCDSAAFSPDGKLLAYSSEDSSSVLICDLSGKTILTFDTYNGHKQPITAIAFSPDGNFIATGSKDRTIKLWKVLYDQQRAYVHNDFKGIAGVVTTLQFTADGEHFLSRSSEGVARTWNIRYSMPIETIDSGNGVDLAALSSDGLSVFVGDRSGAIEQYPIIGRRLRHLCKDDEPKDFNGPKCSANFIQFSRDDNMLIAANSYNIDLWDISGENKKPLFKSTKEYIKNLGRGSDLNLMAFASQKRVVIVDKGRLKHTFPAHNLEVLSVAISSDRSSICTIGKDWEETHPQRSRRLKVKLWSVDGQYSKTYVDMDDTGNDFFSFVAFSPNGKTILVLVGGHSDDGNHLAGLWDLSGNLLYSFPKEEPPFRSAAFAPSGNLLATGDTNGTVKLWSRDCALIKQFKVQERAVKILCWSPDGNHLLTTDGESSIIESDTDGSELQRMPLQYVRSSGQASEEVVSLDYSADGRFFAAATNDGNGYGMISVLFSQKGFLHSDRIAPLGSAKQE